jgi:hypothetical protein
VSLTPETAGAATVMIGGVWPDPRSRHGRDGNRQHCFVFRADDHVRHVRCDTREDAERTRLDWIARAAEMNLRVLDARTKEPLQ